MTSTPQKTDNPTNCLSANYDPKSIESKWYQKWEEAGYFTSQGKGNPYCIMIPPPNVTGSLHMGHGFQYTLMDALVRYHRMLGFDTLWQVGTDHAGIATQMVVERQLLKENITRQKLGREAFLEKIWEWKNISGNRITHQLRRMGASVDWSRERFTMDEKFSEAVKKTFLQLYSENLIYRGKRLVNWDPKLQTAVSDLEVISNEVKGSIWHIKYPIQNHKTSITVATTRPETIFGDVAIAVNPDDERYKHLIGQSAIIPLANRIIPIIADAEVDSTFGTGCVKVTPAHDFTDYNIGKRHNLPMINIFTNDAHLNENVPLPFQGLSRKQAREKVLHSLTEKQFLLKESPHIYTLPIGDRTGEIIEPFLTDQWFVRMESLAQAAIATVKNEKINFIPTNWINTYFQWLTQIEDWCISRQLWWGHRIPAWYDTKGNCYVGNNEEEIRKTYNLPATLDLKQDPDVLDTWFSAALWPFVTLGWPNQTSELKKYYPTQVLITGFDIIFFWVARMVMFGLKFTNQVPFKEVYITGLIRDVHGQKMSKSKGNILDPLDLIDGIALPELMNKRTQGLLQPEMAEKIKLHTIKEFPNGIPPHGCDALRFNFCALASTGRDIRFDASRLMGYRNFCNKLWNAARFVLLQCTDEDYMSQPHSNHLHISDKWILSLLQDVIKNTHKHFQQYRFDRLAQLLHDFVWEEFCSWYLEIAKIRLFDSTISSDNRYATRHTLLSVLENITRLLHPLMPFITEEIWQMIADKLDPKLRSQASSIMIQTFPIYCENYNDNLAESEIIWIKQFITQIRNMRGENNIPPGKKITVLLKNADGKSKRKLHEYQIILHSFAKIETFEFLNAQDTVPNSASAILPPLEIYIPLKDLIDISAEIDRVTRNIAKLTKEHEKLQHKLTNTGFSENAPATIVEQEQNKLLTLLKELSQLKEHLVRLQAL